MNKNYIFAGIGVVGIVAVIIVLVMMNTHPSLAEIVENRDCQEIGKWDQRMDEIYGYDVKKAKAELNISDELFSQARSLGISCALGGAKEVLSGSSAAEPLTRDESFNLLREIVANEDCTALHEWDLEVDFDNFSKHSTPRELLELRHGLVVECEEIQYIEELREIIENKDCKAHTEWYSETPSRVLIPDDLEKSDEDLYIECTDAGEY